MWTNNGFPDTWIESVQCPIPKKPRAAGVDEFRLIALCCGAYKLVARHPPPPAPAANGTAPELDVNQAGFQPGRSTYYHTFVLRRILDEAWRERSTVYILSLYLRRAFPSMSLRAIAEVLMEEGVSPSLVNRVISLALTDRTSIGWGREMT